MAKPSDYEWLERSWVAACITVVSGARAMDVLEAFGADVSIVLEDPDDVYDGSDLYDGAVAVCDIPGGAVAVEDNGYQGSTAETLLRLSRLGPVASIYWSVDDDNAFSCARDGEIVATVDMYDAEDDPGGVSLPDELMALFVQAGDDSISTLWAVGLAMVEAFTAIAPTHEAITSPGPYYAIPSRRS